MKNLKSSIFEIKKKTAPPKPNADSSAAQLRRIVRRAVKNTRVPADLEAKVLNLIKQSSEQTT